MRAYPVLAAGLYSLAVLAPQPGAAQSPAAKAGVQATKHVPRLIWDVGEGWKADPPYELYGKNVGVRVGKLPPARKVWDGVAGPVGTFLGGAWVCDYFGWCHSKK
jgi:hypothetical protein